MASIKGCKQAFAAHLSICISLSELLLEVASHSHVHLMKASRQALGTIHVLGDRIIHNQEEESNAFSGIS